MANISSDLVAKIDRVLTILLGALFTTGAIWTTLAAVAGGWPGTISFPLYIGTVGTAYVVGILTMWWGFSGRPMARPLAAVLVAVGSVAVMGVTVGAGPAAAGVLGGFYTYVAVISFLWFPLPVAIAELAIAGGTYAFALRYTEAPGPSASWIVAMGIAMGGAGLVGLLGQRLRNLYIAESQAAERLRKVDALKNAFLQSVSHELRTPLASVQGFAETLDVRLEELDPDSMALLVRRLRGASERLEGLLTDLLDVERLQRKDLSPHRKDVRIRTLIRSSLDGVDTSGHDLTSDVERGVAHVEGAKVERVVANLAHNAVKHTPKGTRIVVRARPWEGGLRIEVADDGPGLDPDLKERLFHPFEQGAEATRAPSPGAGLGLAVVERFVDLHGGRVWTGPGLDGRGVTFHVEIPGSDPSEDEPPEARVAEERHQERDPARDGTVA